MIIRMGIAWIGLSLVLLGSASADPAPPVRIFAAGSLGGALLDIDRDFTSETGRKVELTLGPAGVLLHRIEQKQDADLFLSANLAHPQRLADEGKGTPPVIFIRNRICMLARRDIGLRPANMLDRLLDPAIRIGTSTPGADPGGDYALLLFAKADTARPGAGEILRQKAERLVGGPIATKVPGGGSPVEYFLEHRTVDVFVGYCSRHEKQPDPRFDQVEVPENLSVPVDYGLTVLSSRGSASTRQVAARFASYLMNTKAQASLAAYGFEPLAADRSH